MRTITIHVVLMGLTAFAPFCAAAQGERPDRPYVTGVVVDPDGKPVAGVQYWTSGYRLGKDGNGGTVHYTGIVTPQETDEDGGFLSVYGGKGRKETAIDVAFQHPDFAPTWLVNANQEHGEYTVTLDPGVDIKGIAAPNGSRTSGDPGPLFQWRPNGGIDVLRRNAGDSATRIPVETDSEGKFTVKLPTDYWNCDFWLHFGGRSSPLKFDEQVIEKSDWLQLLQVNVEFEVDLTKPPEASD